MEAAIARLFDLSRGGDTAELYGILRRFPTIVHVRDGEGCTALHAAASAGSVDVAQLLLQAGASVRDVDKDSWEALHYACANGHFGMAVWLLQNGALLSASTEDGWQPIHVAAHTGQTQLARLLAAQGADLYAATQKGEGAIHLATEAGAVEFVQWLLRATAGEAARITDDDGWLPIHNAAHSGNLPLLRLFANETPDHVMATTSDGCTPLHLAANAGNVAEVKWLLKKGADASAVTSDGLTAEYLAALNGHVELLDLVSLRASGTAVDEPTLAIKKSTAGPQSLERHKGNPAKVAKLSDPRFGEGAGSADLSPVEAPAADEIAHKPSSRTTPERVPALSERTPQSKDSSASKLSSASLSTTVLMNEATARLGSELRAQACHYIDSTLSRALLIKHLKLDLSAVMEKGKVYQARGTSAQLVTWKLRFFFCSDAGLCYQKVNSRMRPFGAKRVVPWGALSKVEALQDDSVYIETIGPKKLYLKMRDVAEPGYAAWTWATRLCQLCQLLGNEVEGAVADAAYAPGLVDAVSADGNVFPLAPDLLTSRLPPPSSSNTQGQRMGYTDLAAMRGTGFSVSGAPEAAPAPGPEDDPMDEASDESDESPEEVYRRQQWIKYYISIGEYTEAEEIGWDRRDPPDPRALLPPASSPAVETSVSEGDDQDEREALLEAHTQKSKSSSSSSRMRTPKMVASKWLQQKMEDLSPRASSRGESVSGGRGSPASSSKDGESGAGAKLTASKTMRRI